MVMNQQITQSAVDFLESELTALGEDVNGDGKVKVTIQALDIGTGSTTHSQTAKQTVLGHIVARDVSFFVLTPTYYTESLAPAMRDGELFFAKLNATDAGLSADGTYWNWKGSTALQQTALKEQSYGAPVEQELYFGVRATAKTDDAEFVATKKLLEAFIAKYPVA